MAAATGGLDEVELSSLKVISNQTRPNFKVTLRFRLVERINEQLLKYGLCKFCFTVRVTYHPSESVYI